MHFTKASKYGIRSVAFMAARRDREMISIRELSRELDIPPAFLTKVMQRLASRNIVQTMRGFGGGVALGKPPGEITLKEIINAVEGEEAFQPVSLGIPREQMEKTPDFFKKWNNLNDTIDLFFSLTKLSELCPAEKPGPANAIGKEAGSVVDHDDAAGLGASPAGRGANAAEDPPGSSGKPAAGNTAEGQNPYLHS